ncbi:MAG: phosphoribosylglycinamide formyltransferase [Betaproteobacteria bacterium]|nr:MAG: phosphoribosylglycinamide formyltransferase [Betaproteobacteria bacterium]
MKRLVILISGHGSNMSAILDAVGNGKIDGEVMAVISNRTDAAGLALAADRGIATMAIDHRAHPSRDAFENALTAAIDAHAPDLIVLAGFMRILSRAFVDRYGGRMINIHPSLLPTYPGLDTHSRALADGVRIHGCTVHFVTGDVDHGPIIAQASVPVRNDDDAKTLAARVLEAEHRTLVAAVGWYCAGRLVIDGARVRVKNEHADLPPQIVPAPDLS